VEETHKRIAREMSSLDPVFTAELFVSKLAQMR